MYRPPGAGKVVFLAPTKPLVNQQVEACYGIMGIPQVRQPPRLASATALHIFATLSALRS